MIRHLGVIAALLLCASAIAHAECGPTNPNCIVPLVQPYTASNDQAASTQFVQGAIIAAGGGGGGGGLIIGTSPVVGGTPGFMLSVGTGPLLQQTATTGSGSVVLNSSPSLTTPTLTAPTLSNPAINGFPSGSGSIITINSTNCALGSSCAIASGALTPGITTIASGTPNGLLYDNAGVLGNLATANSGVLITSGSGAPSIATTLPSGLTAPSLTVTSAFTATGLVTNADLVNDATTVNGQVCTLGGTCTAPAAAGTLTGTTLASGVVTSSLTTVGTIGTGAWQGTPVDLPYGGTNANLTASDGGIVYSTASALAVLAGTATASQCLLSGSNAAPTWGSCSGAAAVSSVNNSDGTLVATPTTGAVIISLALSNPNTWTGAQTFGNSNLLLAGSSSGAMTLEAPAAASTYVMTFPAATGTVAVLGTAQTFTAPQSFTNNDMILLGSSSGTTTIASANAGASNFTLTMPAVTSTVAVLGTLNQNFTATETFSGTLSVTGVLTGAGVSTYLASPPAIGGTAPAAGSFTTLALSGAITVKTRNASSTTDSISATTDYLVCPDNGSAGATENLPATPATGLTFLIKDCGGTAATHNITVTPNAGTIDGGGTFVMNTNYQSIAVTYTGAQWSIN